MPIPKKGNAKECSNCCTIALISHASKVTVKILRSNCQHPLDHCKSKRVLEKHFCFIDYTKAFDCVDHNKQENSSRDGNTRPPVLRNLYACQEATVRNVCGTTDYFQNRKGVCQGCILSPHFFNLYAEYIMRMLGWMKDKLESRLPGEISITSDMHMTPPLWQKVKKN